MAVRECLPTEKFRAYEADLNRKKQAVNHAEVELVEYELELIRKSRFIEINGVVHHYRVSGPRDAEETVLLVHGWDCWWMWWHHIIKALNESGIRTVAYDLKGHGWSEPDPQQHYSIVSFANDLAEIVKKLGLKDFHVAAFSFGSFVTLDYAQKTTDSVRSIVFYNFGFLPNNVLLERFAPAVLTFTFNKVLRKIRWWQPIYVYVRLVLTRNAISFHDIMIGVKSLELCAPEVVDKTTRQITSREVTRSLPEAVKRIDIPLLFVAGDGDTIMRSKNTSKLQEYARQGSYVCVPKCGHLITLELPEMASELIIGQIRSVKGSL